MDLIPDQCSHPAIEDDGGLGDGAWVAEATGMIDLSSWQKASRNPLHKLLYLRKTHSHDRSR